jgi:hypothetical protein
MTTSKSCDSIGWRLPFRRTPGLSRIPKPPASAGGRSRSSEAAVELIRRALLAQLVIGTQHSLGYSAGESVLT